MPLVYIADDEPNIRRLVAFGLKDSGFESAEFADGETLLAGIKARKPDVIILDWMMPPPDGLAVCRTLRSDADTRDIPILMLTARGEEIDKVLGLELGRLYRQAVWDQRALRTCAGGSAPDGAFPGAGAEVGSRHAASGHRAPYGYKEWNKNRINRQRV